MRILALAALLVSGCATTQAVHGGPGVGAIMAGTGSMAAMCRTRADLCPNMQQNARAYSGAGPFMPR